MTTKDPTPSASDALQKARELMDLERTITKGTWRVMIGEDGGEDGCDIDCGGSIGEFYNMEDGRYVARLVRDFPSIHAELERVTAERDAALKGYRGMREGLQKIRKLYDSGSSEEIDNSVHMDTIALSLMTKNESPSAKCKDCGAFFTSYVGDGMCPKCEGDVCINCDLSEPQAPANTHRTASPTGCDKADDSAEERKPRCACLSEGGGSECSVANERALSLSAQSPQAQPTQKEVEKQVWDKTLAALRDALITGQDSFDQFLQYFRWCEYHAFEVNQKLREERDAALKGYRGMREAMESLEGLSFANSKRVAEALASFPEIK